MFNIVLFSPQIPPNTGNAIRLAAVTGAHLHLVEPLGFDLSDAQVKRAGLDYHDMANVTVHPNLAALWELLGTNRAFAFSSHATRVYSEVDYAPGDFFIFGPEPTGLPAEVLNDAHIAEQLWIPMLSERRSLNLANAASIVVYEAWRQHGFSSSDERLAAAPSHGD